MSDCRTNDPANSRPRHAEVASSEDGTRTPKSPPAADATAPSKAECEIPGSELWLVRLDGTPVHLAGSREDAEEAAETIRRVYDQLGKVNLVEVVPDDDSHELTVRP